MIAVLATYIPVQEEEMSVIHSPFLELLDELTSADTQSNHIHLCTTHTQGTLVSNARSCTRISSGPLTLTPCSTPEILMAYRKTMTAYFAVTGWYRVSRETIYGGNSIAIGNQT